MLSRNKGDNVFFCLLSQNKTKTRKVQLLSARARYCLVIVVVVVVVVVVRVFVLSLSFVLRDFPLSNCESTFISHARLPNFPFRNDFFSQGATAAKGAAGAEALHVRRKIGGVEKEETQHTRARRGEERLSC